MCVVARAIISGCSGGCKRWRHVIGRHPHRRQRSESVPPGLFLTFYFC